MRWECFVRSLTESNIEDFVLAKLWWQISEVLFSFGCLGQTRIIYGHLFDRICKHIFKRICLLCAYSPSVHHGLPVAPCSGTFPWRKAGDVYVSPSVWNLRAVIWFHFTVSFFVLLPSPVTLTVFFSASWPILMTFFSPENSSTFFVKR